MIEMFSTHIDFNSDLRRGDHFNVVYETFWQNGKLLKTGNILAAEFVNAGEAHQIIWFERLPGKGDYYDFNGKSNKKAFLRSPLEFTRVSSGFATRVHPVTGNIRQHKGIDFAAPTGLHPCSSRRHNQLLGMAKRIWQFYCLEALGSLFHRLRTYEPDRAGYVQRQKSQPGGYHRICWIDWSQYRPTPSLRIQGR